MVDRQQCPTKCPPCECYHAEVDELQAEVKRLSSENSDLKRLADDAEELFSHLADDDDVSMWRQSYRAISDGKPGPFNDDIWKDVYPDPAHAQQNDPK